MPTPEPRTRADGSTSWRVRFRHQGRQLSRAYNTAADAQRFCDWITAFGAARALELDAAEDARILADLPTNPIPTLDEWAERYIASLPSASTSTKDGYRSTYRHSFGRFLGQMRLDQLDRELIATTIAKLTTTGGRTGNGYSDKSIRNQHGLLYAMLDAAALDGHIPANPCQHIRLPRRTEHTDVEPRFLLESEFWELRAQVVAINPHHVDALDTLIGTGVRWGELEAFTVTDWDRGKQRLRVTKAAKTVRTEEGRNRRIIGPPKSRKSRRDVAVDDTLADTLDRLAHGRAATDRLFTSPTGRPLSHKVWWQDVWRTACRRAGLTDPYPRIHDLRHTHASWLIAEGVGMKVLQERLGHESLKTTMDLYAHLLPGAERQAADAMSRVWERRTRPVLHLVDGGA